MKYVLVIAAALFCLVGIVFVSGSLMPERHLATAQRIVASDAARVAATIRDVEHYSEWRKGVTVSAVERADGVTRYTETQDGDSIRFELTEPEPGQRFVVKIVSEDLPFSGQWGIALSPEEAGTRVIIVESGAVSNPFFRFVSAVIIGHTASMNAYLDALESTGKAQT